MKKKIVKLNENDIETLVKKIIKEDGYEDDPRYDDERARMVAYDNLMDKHPNVAELHDEVLYISHDYRLSGSKGPGVEVFEQMMDAIEMDGAELTDEAKAIIKRLEYDLSALDGFDERVVKLYEIISGQKISD